jgi:tyrosyl-tRNA synthetase
VGTGLVGDPSGRTETRKLLSMEQIESNAEVFKEQFSRYMTFESDKALLLNNGDWLVGLKYIEFLRDIGVHFSVNKMLTAESIKQRLEKGLTFIEFNYMALQAFDFYVLNRDHDCDMQMGGQDQWGNIVAGIDLTRRMSAKEAYGLTFPLITSSSGEKFGKSVRGAVWLDAEKTSPYDYYQFFRNTMDPDVGRYLGYFTFLPMGEVRELSALQPPLLNRAKEILAFEATAMTHGPDAARNAFKASTEKFGEADPNRVVSTSSAVAEASAGDSEHPAVAVDKEKLRNGISILDAFCSSGLCESKGEARRLIRQGGAYIDGKRVDDENLVLKEEDFNNGEINLRAGKKRYMKLEIG